MTDIYNSDMKIDKTHESTPKIQSVQRALVLIKLSIIYIADLVNRERECRRQFKVSFLFLL